MTINTRNLISLEQNIRFDPEKAIETILCIASCSPQPDIYHICKAVYFADKRHLKDFGRLICGDRYVAMRNGPVPSGIYDLLKDVRDNRTHNLFYDRASTSFSVDSKHHVSALRECDKSLFSDSDIECLDQAVEQYGDLSFGDLKQLSHDAAYESADMDDYISLDAIVNTLEGAEIILEHLTDPCPDQ